MTADAPTYAVEGEWLVEVVNEHTCGTGRDGYFGAHEPGCGTVPVGKVADLLHGPVPDTGLTPEF